MNAPDKLPPETRQPVSGYLWGALAVLTCPCHLPILAAVLAGTTARLLRMSSWMARLSSTMRTRRFRGVIASAFTGMMEGWSSETAFPARPPPGAPAGMVAARR